MSFPMDPPLPLAWLPSDMFKLVDLGVHLVKCLLVVEKLNRKVFSN